MQIESKTKEFILFFAEMQLILSKDNANQEQWGASDQKMMLGNKKSLQPRKATGNHPKWALTDSNRRPSACKADALNQLS